MQIVALFGEAEKGAFKTAHSFRKLPHLYDLLGHPPAESEGLFFAVQALLYNREILFFRVMDEGYSRPEYFHGLKYLENRDKVKKLDALCLPGVGDPGLLAASRATCELHRCILITTQKDLYDFLTSS
jgi:hypothetical protein